jgi:hypothetical protein
VQQDAARSDQLTLEQQQHIEKEIKESQPLVAPVESPSVLYGEYKGGALVFCWQNLLAPESWLTS